MQSKTIYKILAAVVAVILLVGSCSIGVLVGRASIGIPTLAPAASSDPASTPSTEDLFVPFWEAWQLVHDQYLVQPVDDVKLMQGAIRGMLESLGDEHTSYMDPVTYSDANAPLAGYEGIGAFVNMDGEYLTIAEPIKGSPAEQAGLLPGDQIIAIDGVDMTGTPPEAARLKVLGQAGTQVTLTIRRENVEQPFDVQITRARIVIPSVESRMLDGDIAYVRLNAFGDQSLKEFHTALQELLAQNPKGLIFDLRNNGGGLLDTAIAVASEFIPDGVITYEEYGDGQRQTFEATGDGIAYNVPMIVLVNEFSASASELVAGALQDRGRATLVGVTSFGKGTVQNWVPLANEQGAVRITIARWLTPNERSIHHTGLTPDVEVQLTEEDMQAGNDTQLNRAVELLTAP